MNILYVTSFTREMYVKTGLHLVSSFLETSSDGTLLVCHEGGLADGLPGPSGRLTEYNLDRSAFLREWLAAHRDIIPPALGGTARPCDCDRAIETRYVHRTDCTFHWFNRNASRWFRKIVSLEVALSHIASDAIVWIDSDCRFTNRLPSSVFAELFEDVSVLYHKSPDRAVIESGVIAFKRDAGGHKVLTSVIDRFRTGTFRRDVRWDDGYQFQVVIDACPDVVSKDLGRRGPAEEGWHVLPSSPLGAYLTHFKGVHTEMGLMG